MHTVKKEKAEFVKKPENVEVMEQEDARFETTVTAKPEPTVEWSVSVIVNCTLCLISLKIKILKLNANVLYICVQSQYDLTLSYHYCFIIIQHMPGRF